MLIVHFTRIAALLAHLTIIINKNYCFISIAIALALWLKLRVSSSSIFNLLNFFLLLVCIVVIYHLWLQLGRHFRMPLATYPGTSRMKYHLI